MSFSIYHQSGTRLTFVSPLKLTGQSGLLASYLGRHARVETPWAWQLPAREIMALERPDLDPGCHCITIDLMPESLFEVCLYRLTFLQGVSETDESDVVLASRALFQGRAERAAPDFKRAFDLIEPEGDRQMMEALRLTGGTLKGRYFWAKPKMDIGAAVCPAIPA